MNIWTTSFCNHGHDLKDGKPVAHECYVLDPKVLAEEKAGNFQNGADIVAKPRKAHKGKRRPPQYEHGDYMDLIWDYDDHEEYIRGHVTLEEAQAIVKNYTGGDIVRIEQKHARWTPSRDSSFDQMLNIAKQGVGTFPVTEVFHK